MQHMTLDQITPVAKVVSFRPDPSREERRARLARLADLLASHDGPVRLFSGIEHLRARDRESFRQDCSPFTVAFQDTQFRREGLMSDRVGDGMAFFGLSFAQTHRLFCECHYDAFATPQTISGRVRSAANHVTFSEMWDKAVTAIRARLS